MKERIHKALTLSTMAAVLFAGTLAAREQQKDEHGNPQCSNATLNGSYGVSATGTVIGVGSVALIAVFKYDGQGNFTGTVIQKVNGNNVQVTFTGTYVVDADCFVSDVTQISNGQTHTHTSVIVNDGKEFFILNTTAPTATSGNVISGVGKKQFSEDD
jgi:hypothetical protein